MASILEVNNLQTGFEKAEGTLKVVRGIDFDVEEGEILGIVGESGSGKSVTALSIMRLLHDTPGKILDGEVKYKGTDLLRLTEKEIDRKSTRLNSSHVSISYAVFCLKKKTKKKSENRTGKRYE